MRGIMQAVWVCKIAIQDEQGAPEVCSRAVVHGDHISRSIRVVQV